MVKLMRYFWTPASDTALWLKGICQVGVSIPIPPVLTFIGISVHHSVNFVMLERPTESNRVQVAFKLKCSVHFPKLSSIYLVMVP